MQIREKENDFLKKIEEDRIKSNERLLKKYATENEELKSQLSSLKNFQFKLIDCPKIIRTTSIGKPNYEYINLYLADLHIGAFEQLIQQDFRSLALSDADNHPHIVIPSGVVVNLGQAFNGQLPNGQTPDGQTFNGKRPKGKRFNGQAPSDQDSNAQAPNGQTSNEQTPNGQDSNGKTPKGKRFNGQAPDGQTQNEQTPNGKAPRGNGFNGQTPNIQSQEMPNMGSNV